MVGVTEGKVYILASPEALKVVSATFLLVCFLSLKKSTCETRKNIFFISLQKLISPSRKSNFRFLDIQILDVIKCLSIKQEIHFTEEFGK